MRDEKRFHHGAHASRCGGLEIRFPDANDGEPLMRGVDLTIRAGECVALVGESGSGESLTARSLIGLAGYGARISAQRFEIDGRSAQQFRERDWRGVRGGFAGLVMQDALVSLALARDRRRDRRDARAACALWLACGASCARAGDDA